MRCEDVAPLKGLWLSGVFVEEQGEECAVSIRAKKVDIDPNRKSVVAQVYGYPDIVAAYADGVLVVTEKGKEVSKVGLDVRNIEVSGAPDEYLIILKMS